MLVVPKRLFDVPVDVPNPKPVLVEEVAGWLNVVDPNNPPADRNRLLNPAQTPLLGGLGGCLVVFLLVPGSGFPFPHRYRAAPVPMYLNNSGHSLYQPNCR